MCMRCELQLFDDHRAAEREFFEPCPECGKIPPSASGNECYHSFGSATLSTSGRSVMETRGARNFSRQGKKSKVMKRTLLF